ncbi:MAG TPA: DNA polymerase III subunit gamma/tau [Candidatus Limnocylindria bacterium]|nr:DNA polymerase III subunit gamma/tau [Candidatus Limnocylindria bacterium]
MPPADPAAVDAHDAALQAAAPHRALYRKFRAQCFAELIGQDPIVTTLRRAVSGDRIAHAYLFVGPRGTGKTSTARILAKAINCTDLGADGEPCDACASCVSIREGRALDVIEIDAASHGAVEDARDLVMRALTSPSELRKRVYIIDEVHMLSSHAFNALLKLIEEPPDHVVFILATTDTHKVPATIISRTQRHDFRRLAEATIVGKLSRICEAEGAEADEEALALIARLADGGMRDAESLLDQVLAYASARVTVDDVRDAVGLADDAAIARLLDAYLAADAPAALDAIAAMADAGRDLAQVAAQAETEARRRLLASAADPDAARRLAAILRAVAEAAGPGAREGRARLTLELLAVDTGHPVAAAAAPAPAPVRAAQAQPQPAASPRQPAPAPTASAPPPAAAASEPAARARPEPKGAPEPEQPVATPVGSAPAPVAANGTGGSLDELRASWAAVIDRASPVIKPLLKECRPVARDGARVTLAFPEGRDFMRANIARRANQIEALLTEMFGGAFAIECVATNVELEPLTVEQAVGNPDEDPEARALLEGVLKITGGELVDAPEVR